jgi:hypothetical protein
MIGALAMILALGFDPFIQNLVHYNTVYNPDFERNSSLTTANEFDFSGAFGQLGSDAKGRIQSGIYSVSDSLRVPSYACDTGNCTWLGYNTLAVGVHCADLTSELIQTCSNDTALQVCYKSYWKIASPVCLWSGFIPIAFQKGCVLLVEPVGRL